MVTYLTRLQLNVAVIAKRPQIKQKVLEAIVYQIAIYIYLVCRSLLICATPLGLLSRNLDADKNREG